MEALAVALEAARFFASAALSVLQPLPADELSDFGIEGSRVSLHYLFLCCLDQVGAALVVAALLASAVWAARLSSSEALAVQLEALRLGAGAFFDFLFV